MNYQDSDRGFGFIMHPSYLPPHELKRVVSESSAIGDYENAFNNPGSSFIWVGESHHLNREEVKELTESLLLWLETGRLKQSAK